MNQREDLEDELAEKKYIASLSEKGITIDFSREDIETHLPHLAAELNDSNNDRNKDIKEIYQSAGIDSIDSIDEDEIEIINPEDMDEETLNEFLKIQKQKMKNLKSKYNEDSELYYPKTQDFLRRCTDIKEAEEIISYQLKMGEITIDEAETLLKICKEKGLEYFGPTKKSGYYERTYRKNY